MVDLDVFLSLGFCRSVVTVVGRDGRWEGRQMQMRATEGIVGLDDMRTYPGLLGDFYQTGR